MDAQTEWWALQSLGKTAREQLRAANLPLTRRLRRLQIQLRRGTWSAEHPWGPVHQALLAACLERSGEVLRWQAAPCLLGHRPLLWLTSHQDE